MKKGLKVFKFGGSALRNAEAIVNVGMILQRYRNERLMIVVSAMGKTTDALENVVKAHALQNGEAEGLLQQVKQFHFDVLMQFFDPQHEVFARLNDAFVEIDWVLEDEPSENYDYMYDQIVSVGEIASSIVLHAYLNQIGLPTQWLDSRDVIITDNIYREGWVQWEATLERYTRTAAPMLEQDGFVVAQGFIASTTENFTTTLGREGSDYSAAIYSYCMDAESMSIWKDVPGVLTADPKLFHEVEKIDRLSYREAIEMTYYGARVIHPKTIKPLQNKSIPLFVKSYIDPEGSGTYIGPDIQDNYPPIVAIEPNQALLQISTRDFSFVAEHHISHLFQHISEKRLQVNLMQNSAISFNIAVNDIDDRIDRFAKDIEENFKVIIERNLELITVRHAKPELLANLKRGKRVLLEERIQNTVQLLVKDVPVLRRKLK